MRRARPAVFREKCPASRAESVRLGAMNSLIAAAETMELTLEQMKAVEDMRRTLRDIRDVNKLDQH